MASHLVRDDVIAHPIHGVHARIRIKHCSDRVCQAIKRCLPAGDPPNLCHGTERTTTPRTHTQPQVLCDTIEAIAPSGTGTQRSTPAAHRSTLHSGAAARACGCPCCRALPLCPALHPHGAAPCRQRRVARHRRALHLDRLSGGTIIARAHEQQGKPWCACVLNSTVHVINMYNVC